MRHVLLAILGVAVGLTALAQPTPTAPTPIVDPTKLETKNVPEMQNFSIEKLFTTRTVGGSTWSPDGKEIAFVDNLSGRDNLWLVPAAGGWPAQLTISEQRPAKPVWSPDGTWIAFLSGHDGDELWDIFLVSPKTGDVVNLVTSSEGTEEDLAWAPDGRQIAYTSRLKTSSSFEVELMDIATRHVRHLTSNTSQELTNSHPIFSKDGKFLVYTQSRADGSDSNVFLLDLASGQRSDLTNHEGGGNSRADDISPDGKTVLIASGARNSFDDLGLLQISTRKVTWLYSDKRTIQAATFLPDGKFVIWIADANSNTNILRYDIASKKTEALPFMPGVNALGGNPVPYPRDSKLLYSHTSAALPNDLWIYDFVTRQSVQLTRSLVAGVRSADMVEPRLVQYPSGDGKSTTSALAYIPNNIQRNGKFPAIVYLHDGPDARTLNSFDPFIQYIVNQGYVVISPEYSRSAGDGMGSRDANHREMGSADLGDVLDAAEWIKRSGFVDPKKLIAMGSGYGGYLSLAAVSKTPSLWSAAVAISPIVNWSTETANHDPAPREFVGDKLGKPAKDKSLPENPTFFEFVDHIEAPTLLIAGAKDPHSPKDDLQRFVDMLKKRGGIAQLKIYEEEGHSLTRVSTKIDAYQRVSDFLKVHVPSPGCGCSIYE